MRDFGAFEHKVVSFEGSSLTCFTGPNASGKSSVFRALCFLLKRDHEQHGCAAVAPRPAGVGSGEAAAGSLEAGARHALGNRQCSSSSRSSGGGLGLAGLVRRGSPQQRAEVTAHFEAEGLGIVTLRREVRLLGATGVGIGGDSERERTCDTALQIESSYWIGCVTSAAPHAGLRRVSAEDYSAWVSESLRWTASGEALLPQFALLADCAAERLLAQLPEALRQAGASGAPPPLLKRRSRIGWQQQRPSPQKQQAQAEPQAAAQAQPLASLATEAWAARRIDEIFRELTREPLDEDFEEWGEGGQACLRRLSGGAAASEGFDLLLSRRRGVAACGYGTPLAEASDGERDLCALALLLTLAGLRVGLHAGLADSFLPAFVALDEPDSRLDKRHAKALHRFLNGPQGPKQCMLLSLDNHGALGGAAPL